MFELKNSFIYKACKKIEETNIESENLDSLKFMAKSIDKSLCYFNDICENNNKDNYIYTAELDGIWKSAYGGVLDVDSESYINDKDDVIGNFAVYFSLFKSFLNDFYIAVAYSADERAFRFNNCWEEIEKITKNLENDNDGSQVYKMSHFDKLYRNFIQKILFYDRLSLVKNIQLMKWKINKVVCMKNLKNKK